MGRTIAGRYVVERLLGKGGMGAVYLVRHIRTGGQFALKTLLLHDLKAESETFRRFQDEAKIVSGLRHPNIVQVTDFDFDDQGNPFMIMEFLEGEDLNERLEREKKLPLAEALNLAEQIGDALQAAHDRSIVHRDVKPHNIFITNHSLPGQNWRLVKILDFGISKIRRSQSQATKDNTFIGTPQFMSPEAAQGQVSAIDSRSDQFSMAAILYEALSAQPAFPGDNMMAILWKVVNVAPPPLRQVEPDIPISVSDAVMRALSKDPAERFPCMREFIEALSGKEPGEMPSSAPRSLSPALLKQSTLSWATWFPVAPRQRRTVAIAGGIGLLLTGLVAAAVLGRRTGISPSSNTANQRSAQTQPEADMTAPLSVPREPVAGGAGAAKPTAQAPPSTPHPKTPGGEGAASGKVPVAARPNPTSTDAQKRVGGSQLKKPPKQPSNDKAKPPSRPSLKPDF